MLLLCYFRRVQLKRKLLVSHFSNMVCYFISEKYLRHADRIKDENKLRDRGGVRGRTRGVVRDRETERVREPQRNCFCCSDSPMKCKFNCCT